MTKSLFNEKDADHWIKSGKNVLIAGDHGCGKTSFVMEAFKRNNRSFKMFSGATLDPWTDFVGIPYKNEDCNIDYAVPRFHNDDDGVEFIFIDEYNRTNAKVRNAVMELIQFKSINGKKFKNLKAIWAAVNPFDEMDDKYDVERIDLAQLDRFQIQVEMPYFPNLKFFNAKFGEDVAKVAIEYWKTLEDVVRKEYCSPRRLEYALDELIADKKLGFILNEKCNPSMLEEMYAKLKFNIKEWDFERFETEFSINEALIFDLISDIVSSKAGKYYDWVAKISKESLTSRMESDYRIKKYVEENFPEHTPKVLSTYKGYDLNDIPENTSDKRKDIIKTMDPYVFVACLDGMNLGPFIDWANKYHPSFHEKMRSTIRCLGGIVPIMNSLEGWNCRPTISANTMKRFNEVYN